MAKPTVRIVCVCLNPAIDISSEADNIYPVSKVRTHSERIEPGGGGVNVARVLCSFNTVPTLIYLSGGSTGKVLDEELKRYCIDTQAFRIKAATRVAFTVHQTSNHQEYRFVPEGPVVSLDAYEQAMACLSSMNLTNEDVVVVSGSLPRGIPDTAYTAIAELTNQCGAKFILDSSGAGLSKTLRSESKIFLVKPSLNELQRLAGNKLDEYSARDFVQSLIADNNIEYVAVSMGSHGAFLASANSLLRLPAHLVKVSSAVGAGDSFIGGLVYYLSQGYPIKTAFRFGVAAGAAAVMTPGSQLCQRDAVERLFQSDLPFEEF